ncbi:Photosystem II protein D1, partial [Mucuna pruriens]
MRSGQIAIVAIFKSTSGNCRAFPKPGKIISHNCMVFPKKPANPIIRFSWIEYNTAQLQSGNGQFQMNQTRIRAQRMHAFAAMTGVVVHMVVLSPLPRLVLKHSVIDLVTNIITAHGYFDQLIFQYISFNNSHSLHFFLKAWPGVTIWFIALDIATMAFNLNSFNFNQVVDSDA